MSVLQRKAQVGKNEHQARAMTVPKSLRVGLAKVADEIFDMALVVIGVSQDRRRAEDLGEIIDDTALLLLLDGPGGAGGGAMLEGSLVTALVQQQTTGRVNAAAASTRKMTGTDAALCAPMLDAFFARAHNLLETPQDKNLLNRFKYGARAENKRLFELALENPEYHILRMTIDVAGGTCQSTMTLILPIPTAKPESLNKDETGAALTPRTLASATMSLKADLSAQLCRIQIPLATLSKLKPGQTLALPSEAFDNVELISIEGRCVTKGALGQVDGQRALMLNASGASAKASDASKLYFDTEMSEEPADYSNLDLPELDIPTSPVPIQPGDEADLPDLPDPDLPDFPELDDIGAEDNEPLPDLPDLPDLDGDFPDIDDLPKLNIA